MSNPVSLATIFDQWCSNIPGKEDTEFWESIIKRYGFRLRVVVSKDIPPRHSAFSWIRGLGVSKFDEIFQGDVRLPRDWLLAFPERHCSIDEQSKLISQLVKINKTQKGCMTDLDILTSCPYIISDTMSEVCSIISFPNGKITYNQDYMM